MKDNIWFASVKGGLFNRLLFIAFVKKGQETKPKQYVTKGELALTNTLRTCKDSSRDQSTRGREQLALFSYGNTLFEQYII